MADFTTEELSDIREWVATPDEAVAAGVAYVEELRANRDRALLFPVPMIDGYFAPVIPGQTVAILAQPSNFKSGFISVWEQHLARHLISQKRDDEVIIHVDTEHTLEELAMGEISRHSGITVSDLSRGNVKEWGDVVSAAMKINNVRIFYIANRLGRNRGPQLHLTNVQRAIEALVEGKVLGHKVTPAAVFLDYLQALPIDPIVKRERSVDAQRRLQVREDAYRVKEIAQWFSCPLAAGVQAKQMLSGALSPQMLLPGMLDAEETNAIAQRFSRSIGLWMPKNQFPGDTINHKGHSFQVTDSLLFIRVLKQQGKLPSGRWWDCEINFRNNTITTLSGRPPSYVSR